MANWLRHQVHTVAWRWCSCVAADCTHSQHGYSEILQTPLDPIVMTYPGMQSATPPLYIEAPQARELTPLESSCTGNTLIGQISSGVTNG